MIDLAIGETKIIDTGSTSWMDYRLQLNDIPGNYRLKVMGEKLKAERLHDLPSKPMKYLDFVDAQLKDLEPGDQIVGNIGKSTIQAFISAVPRVQIDCAVIQDHRRGCIRVIKL